MKRLSEITAAVLAGGFGSRLRNVIADRPKVLAEVAGRPFLAYLLDQLVAVHVKSAVLCTGYLARSVVDLLGASYRGLPLIYSEE
ncbi:MAG: NTP transferase domain-containing protein, partial [Planctomycetes bacterium]|nr:NTP transferase domain-containing protein [Planctomycetota bacterium]